MLILPDHFTLNIVKKKTTMIACDYYLYRTGCSHRDNLINPHKHATNTDIQEISLNTSTSSF